MLLLRVAALLRWLRLCSLLPLLLLLLPHRPLVVLMLQALGLRPVAVVGMMEEAVALGAGGVRMEEAVVVQGAPPVRWQCRSA